MSGPAALHARSPQDLSPEQNRLRDDARIFLGYFTGKTSENAAENERTLDLHTSRFFDAQMKRAKREAPHGTDDESLKAAVADRLLEGFALLQRNPDYEIAEEAKNKLRTLVTGATDKDDFAAKMKAARENMSKEDSLFALLMAQDANGNRPNYAMPSSADMGLEGLSGMFNKVGLGGAMSWFQRLFGANADPDANPDYVNQQNAEKRVFQGAWALMRDGGPVSYAHFWGVDYNKKDPYETLNIFKPPTANSQRLADFMMSTGDYARRHELTRSSAPGPVFEKSGFNEMIVQKWVDEGFIEFEKPEDRENFVLYAAELVVGNHDVNPPKPAVHNAHQFSDQLMKYATQQDGITLKSDYIPARLDKKKADLVPTNTNATLIFKAKKIDADEQKGIFDYGKAIEAKLDTDTLKVTDHRGRELFSFADQFSAYRLRMNGTEIVQDKATELDLRSLRNALKDGFSVQLVTHSDAGQTVGDSSVLGYWIEGPNGTPAFYVGPDAIPEEKVTELFVEKRQEKLEDQPHNDQPSQASNAENFLLGLPGQPPLRFNP